MKAFAAVAALLLAPAAAGAQDSHWDPYNGHHKPASDVDTVGPLTETSKAAPAAAPKPRSAAAAVKPPTAPAPSKAKPRPSVKRSASKS